MATPYLENGRHHQRTSFLHNQFSGLYSADFSDSADAFTSQQSILNDDDNSFMNGFFENPEAATAGYFPSWPGVDHKVNSGAMGGQMDGVDDGNQMIHNQGVTLADNRDSLPHAQIDHTSGHMTSHLGLGADELGQGSEDDMKAASGLVGMSQQGQGDPRALAHSEGVMANQWEYYPTAGGFNNTHMQDNITSPITSSGRQSANSYHSQPQSAYMNNHFNNSLSNNPYMQQLHWMQGGQQSMHAQHIPRGRPASLQFDMNAFNNYLATNAQQGHMPRSANPYNQSRPLPVRFGSDDNFGRSGYRGPHNSISLEEEKQGNLINVPLAAQAAANGTTHMHPHLSYMNQQLQNSHQPMPGSSRNVQSISAASSPGAHLGGLPFHSPHFHNANMHGNSYHATVQQQHMEDEEYDDSDEELASPEEQPRKRRKSQMERDDDDDYHPSGHTKANMPRRDAKPTRNFAMQDSDENYTTQAKATAGKRRKSSMAEMRPTLVSSNDNSPSSRPSPAAKQTPASGKKKARDAEPRKNLTEDQKRKNHIHSEKQRRDLIKVQYDALDSLVPALKGGKSGLSRSDVLQEIVAYVESVAHGNVAVESMIEDMIRRQLANAPHADGNEAV